MLKPQDVYALVGLQLLMRRTAAVTLPQIAGFLRLSTSEVHAAIARLQASQLVMAASPELRRPSAANFMEFAEHGLRYVFPPEYGPPTRGLPTGAGAIPGLAKTAQPLVWPLESADGFGPALAPLYRSVPVAAALDPDLHLAMAALDCLRVGRSRERQAGMAVLRELFGAP
jgi:hypothetical protein